MKNVLVESTKSKFQVLAQKPANVLKRIKGVLSDFGSNRNGRIYPRELWENVINSDYVKEMINSHGLVGELDHPEERLEISLQEVSHVINDMWIEGDKVMGIIDILPTPNGKIVNELLDYGTDIGISSRGAGSVGAGNVVDPDYQFITFDFVARPSCEAARLNTILESVKVDLESNSEAKVNTILENYKSGLTDNTNKEKFINYCKDKIKDLGSVNIEVDDLDSEEDSAKKKASVRVDLINSDGTYVLNGEDCINLLNDDGYGGVYYIPETKEVFFAGPMDDWNDNICKLDFQAISNTCYDYILNYWDELNLDEDMDLEEVIKNSDEKIKQELKLPKPLKYNIIHRLGGSDVEVYTNRGVVAKTTVMNGDKHAQDYFDIDGLWQVNMYDKSGKFLKYDYVEGWENMVKLALKQINKSSIKEGSSAKRVNKSYKLDLGYKLNEAMSDQEVYKIVLGWYKDQIESGKMTLNQCYELLSDKAKVSLNKLVDQSKIRESMVSNMIKGILKEDEAYRPNGELDDIKRNMVVDLEVNSPLDLNTGVLPLLDTDTYSRQESIWTGYDDNGNEEDIERPGLDDTMVAYGAPIIEEYLKKVLPSASVKGTGMYHPRQYNFSTDELEFTVDFDTKEYLALEEDAYNDPEFGKFLKDNYSSYDGFFSYLADNLDEFYQQDGWKRFVQVIMFQLRNIVDEEEIESNNEIFWENVLGNC